MVETLRHATKMKLVKHLVLTLLNPSGNQELSLQCVLSIQEELQEMILPRVFHVFKNYLKRVIPKVKQQSLKFMVRLKRLKMSKIKKKSLFKGMWNKRNIQYHIKPA